MPSANGRSSLSSAFRIAAVNRQTLQEDQTLAAEAPSIWQQAYATRSAIKSSTAVAASFS
jgi:hypothetical protein